ncbi:hypothetical protein K7X08_014818 [Anisodus acutangulus]|uniref:Uncharacterized protein n=1 Tax=Anisodus acutangulus TaxID=402998 RepID=A0A9Q1LJ86_9SOLA|nr:hypothetical protein K7X08_014818 [Anisodus acutangulus]
MENMKKLNDFEVIQYNDEFDEHVIRHLGCYKDIKFQKVSASNLKTGKGSDEEVVEPLQHLIRWWTDLLGDVDVELNNDLSESARVTMPSKRVLELNPKHPIIEELQRGVARDPQGEIVKRLALRIALEKSGLEESGDFGCYMDSSGMGATTTSESWTDYLKRIFSWW